MQIDIFDVGHGHCSVITTPNGRRVMADCGTRNRDDRLWWPSIQHFGHEIAVLSVLNLDEDHLRDFGSVLSNCRVRSVLTNPTIGPREFRALKEQGMGPGARAYLDWLSLPAMGVPQDTFELGGVGLYWFWNHFGGPCKSANDLSVGLFVWLGGFKMLFAGDLEAKGWRGMLANPEFRRLVMGVNIFVAAHHGRENGCCDELFELMNPELVVISDDIMQHGTQETNSWYRWRCRGAALIADPRQRRYVMTTRNDGSMRINASADGSWRLQPKIAVTDYPLVQPDARPSFANALTAPLAYPNDPFGFGGLNFLTGR